MNLQLKLIRWFRKNARPLPWRKRYDPYEVWVSEIMLQQTQMDTVLPYFHRWMRTFPTLEALARSGEKKVLKNWEGLGYYSRARNLHQSAKIILKKHAGVFPSRYEDILSLKGVGRYTAGAIASIAFNQPKPIVDGNVLRVLSRVYAIQKPIDTQENKEFFFHLEQKLIPPGQARYFNQALMELGALVCTARNPACLACPLRSDCKAFRKNRVEDYPVRRKRRKTVKVQAAALILQRNGKYLIHKRPGGQIMGGLWEFPEWKLARNQKMAPNEITQRLKKLAEKDLGLKIAEAKFLGAIKRNYTHHLERLQVFEADPAENSSRLVANNTWPHAWISQKDFQKYPFSSAHAKIAKLITG